MLWMSIISGLNYKKINEKYLKKIEKLKKVDIGLSSHQRDWEKFEQENNSIALNILFVSYNSEELHTDRIITSVFYSIK